mgnify:CR=1 FL=1
MKKLQTLTRSKTFWPVIASLALMLVLILLPTGYEGALSYQNADRVPALILSTDESDIYDTGLVRTGDQRCRVRICKEELGLRVTQVNALGGGSEDFSCMSQRVQQRGGQAAYVGLLCACPAANHNDHFDFDEQALANGAAMFTAVTASLLA